MFYSSLLGQTTAQYSVMHMSADITQWKSQGVKHHEQLFWHMLVQWNPFTMGTLCVSIIFVAMCTCVVECCKGAFQSSPLLHTGEKG